MPLAVIHPSPKKKRDPVEENSPNLELFSNPLKLQRRMREEKDLPDHLIRVPVDPNATPKA